MENKLINRKVEVTTNQETEIVEKTKLQYLAERLAKHDYTYMMSDDHRYWVSGTADEKEIRTLIAECNIEFGKDKVDALITKYKSEYGTRF